MKNKFNSKDYYFFLLFLFLSLLIITSGGGADYTQYLIWSEYFSTQNLSVFSEYPKSKNGLPLVQWHYGIGLLSAIPIKILFIDGVIAMKIISALLTVINFFLIYKISRNYKISKVSFLLIITVIYLLLPAGFYLNKYSSETWTIFLTLLSIIFIEHDIRYSRNANKITLLAFSIILYFLVLVKVTNIFLCFALLLIFYIKKFGKTKINKRNFNKYFQILFFGSLFILLAIILLAIYYKLLNGNFLASPYNYGDNTFSSFSISNFKLIEVLFSTWHGLFFYHPFYFVSIFILSVLFFNKTFSKNNSKWILLVALITFFIQLIIQSSQNAWWMGTGTYGARGFAGISILTIYAMLNFENNLKFIKKNFFLQLIAIVFLCHQTYLLSMQETNFYAFSNFISFFFTEWSLILFFKILLILVLMFFLKKKFNYNFIKFLQLTIISMAFFAAIDIFFAIQEPYFLLFIAIFLSYFFSQLARSFIKKNKLTSNFFMHKAASIIFIILFVFSIYFQTILFVQYKENGDPNFASGNNFDCIEAVGTFNEYNYIPNYQHEKNNWSNFLKKSGCL